MQCRSCNTYLCCESTTVKFASTLSSGTNQSRFISAHSGFTLIELVITILLVAILSAFAIPRLLGNTEFSAQTLADQVISHLQQAQVQAINHRSGSYCVGFIATKYGLPSNCASGLANADQSFDLPRATSITLSGNATFQINFDFLGRPIGASCNGGCQFQAISAETVNICVEAEGYIYAC